MLHTTATPDTSLTRAINAVGLVCLSLILIVFTSLSFLVF